MNIIRQRGVSLITAIFLLVVVASIGAFMVNIGQTQQQTAVLSVLGARAHQAALSGLEWGIQRAVIAAGAGLDCTPGTVNVALNAATMDQFTVAVTCTLQTFDESGTNYNVYTLSSNASLNAFGNPDFISRTLRASVCVSCP